MALTTSPSRAAQTVTASVAASLTDTMLPITEVHDLAMPTLKILMRHRQRVNIGPDFKIRGNMFHGYQDAWVGARSMELPTDVKDNLTQIEFDPVILGSSNSINVYEINAYRSESAIVDVGSRKVDEMHGGLTHAFNYSLFSNFGAATAEVANGEIDLDTFISNVNPGVKIKGNVSENALRWHSIPQHARHDNSGNSTHTWGNLTSANAQWEAHVITHGTVAFNTTGTDYEQGLVTSVTNPVPFKTSMLDDLLDDMQVGGNYTLYAAMPPRLYSSAVRVVWAQGRGTPDNPLAQLDIPEAITYPGRNCVLYSEPLLADAQMFPNSIFVFDPTKLFIAVDASFDPYVWPWQPVNFGTVLGLAEVYFGQLVCIDRRGVGAIHGVAQSG